MLKYAVAVCFYMDHWENEREKTAHIHNGVPGGSVQREIRQWACKSAIYFHHPVFHNKEMPTSMHWGQWECVCDSLFTTCLAFQLITGNKAEVV